MINALFSYARWLDDGPLNMACFLVLMGLDFNEPLYPNGERKREAPTTGRQSCWK